MGTAQRPTIPPTAVTDLAAARGLGAYQSAELRGDSGCLGCFAFVVLLPPGIGLTIGPYGRPGAIIGVGLLVLGIAVVVLSLRQARHPGSHGHRAYCFEGGIVLADRRRAPTPYAWVDLEAVEWTETATVGQGLNQSRYDVLELRDRDGTPLIRCGQLQAARVIDLIAADEATRAMRLLRQGRSVRYGRFTLTSTGLTIAEAPSLPDQETTGPGHPAVRHHPGHVPTAPVTDERHARGRAAAAPEGAERDTPTRNAPGGGVPGGDAPAGQAPARSALARETAHASGLPERSGTTPVPDRRTLTSTVLAWREVSSLDIGDTHIELVLRPQRRDGQDDRANRRPNVRVPRQDSPQERVALTLIRRQLCDPGRTS